MNVVAIIPARMASSRFPGKPVHPILGIPMVEHVRRRVEFCKNIRCAVVATCDNEIMDAVTGAGGDAVMTLPSHESCVDRVAEAAGKLDAEIIVNVQGDMPLINPASLDLLVQIFIDNSDVCFADMVGPIFEPQEVASLNVVKVVSDKSDNALYYSREPIPSSRKTNKNIQHLYLKQFGVNAFRREYLIRFSQWPRTELEDVESVDMLRVLERGYDVRLLKTQDKVVGVDTIEDLKRAEHLMEKDGLYKLYGSRAER